MAVSATPMGFVILILAFFFFWVLRSLVGGGRQRKSNGRLPPGPTAFPIIGNLHQLGNPAQRTLQDLAKKYGDIIFLRLGSVPTLIVSSSEAAKLFLKTHDLSFANRPATAAGKYMFYNNRDIALAPYGSYWRHVRKICVLELLTAKRVDSFRSTREEESSLLIRSIWEKSGHGRVVVDVSESMASFTCSVSWRMLSGRKYGEQDLGGGGHGFKWFVGELSELSGAFNIGDFIPFLEWLDLQGLKRRMKKMNKLFDGLAEKIIEEHIERRRQFAHVQKEKYKKDLVDVLLDIDTLQTDVEFTRQDMKALMLDLFTGGMETTLTTLEWAMSNLIQNPNVMKKLQEEIECVVGKDRIVIESDLRSIEYLHCVVNETLRLYPAVPLLVPHESTQDCMVEGHGRSYFIPAKTRLMVNAWAIGRDPCVWEDPLSFKPERFVGRNYDVIRDQGMNMIPFGSGRRGCPGSSMAIANLQIAIAQLVHCFDWRIEGDPSMLDMNEVFGVTIPRKVYLTALPSWQLISPYPLMME